MDAEKARDKAIEAAHAGREAYREWMRQVLLEEGWKPGDALEDELDAMMEDR